MKAFLWFALISLTFSTLGSAQHNTIVIYDKSNNKNFGFFYCDQFNDLKNSLTLRSRDSSGNKYTITTNDAVVVIFTKGITLKGYPVLLFPGDTCEVFSDGVDFMFKSNSRSKGDLHVLSDLEQVYGFVFPDNMGLIISNKLNIRYVAGEIEKKYLNRVRFIRDYNEQHMLSRESKDFLEKAIRQKYIVSLLFPFYVRQDSAGFNLSNIPDEYYILLEEAVKDAFDDSQLHMQNYQLLLWNYCKYLSKDALNTDSEFSEMFSNAQIYFSGKSKEFLMFLILKKYGNLGLKEYQEKAEKFMDTHPNSELGDYLIFLIPKNQTANMLKAADEKLETYMNTEISWKDILNSNKGKILYIDFWASWCSPCLQEMPDSDRLRELFKNDSISFLYISVDQKKNAWISTIDKLRQNTENHFLLKSNSQLQKVFDVKTVPKYLILDSEGNILTSNAQRPSDPLLINTLRELLNK